jgi:glutamine cyclotransferase
MRTLILLALSLLAAACSGSTSTAGTNAAKPANTAAPRSGPPPVYGFEVVKSYPHDPQAFTQGLLFHSGFLYESTGEYGESTIRKVEIETGKVLQKASLPKDDFGEGLALAGDKLYNITWREGICRVYNLADFKLEKEFNYQGEGWGLASDGTSLFMTDSTHVIRVLNPDTFRSNRMISVMRDDGKPLMQLNELEFVKGELWANIWHSEQKDILGKPNHIARIDPATGKIVGWIDLDGLSPEDTRRDVENQMNGIAYDAASDRIFVTGKKWKKLYEIKVTGPKAS